MLSGNIPNIGDLCEIRGFSYKETPCEILEVDNENFRYRIIFNLANGHETHWLGSEYINWIVRKYKILNLTESREDESHKSALIVEATPYNICYIEKHTNPIRIETYTESKKSAEIFILKMNTIHSDHFLNEPENPKLINLTHYKKGTWVFEFGTREVYFHEDY
jgi:hypothetical protein